MPDPTLSTAIREAYASAPADEVILHTLELWHPSFATPIRVVRDRDPVDARLEAGAPRDASAVVTFAAYAFYVLPPETISEGLPQARIEIDNVSREIVAQLDLAALDPAPVRVIYRAYLASDLDSGPENDPPLSLTVLGISVTVFRIVATCGFRDLVNRRFPRLDYQAETFPGLVA